MEAICNQGRKTIQGVLDDLSKVVPYIWSPIFLRSVSHNLQDREVVIVIIVLIDQEGCRSTTFHSKFSMFQDDVGCPTTRGLKGHHTLQGLTHIGDPFLLQKCTKFLIGNGH